MYDDVQRVLEQRLLMTHFSSVFLYSFSSVFLYSFSSVCSRHAAARLNVDDDVQSTSAAFANDTL